MATIKKIAPWAVLLAVIISAGFSLLKPTTNAIYKSLYPREYQGVVEKYSKEYQVDRNLIYAVIKVESNFDPKAHSKADARGLMQITKDAFEWVQYRMGDDSSTTYDDIFDPEVSVKYGTYMLGLLLEDMGEETLAICAYHAGMGNVRSWLEQEAYSKDGVTLDKIPYKDTAWYEDEVRKAKGIYLNLYS